VHASIPKEITEYHEKIMFGLSIRQLCCFSAAILAGVATWLLCARVLRLSLNTVSYVVIAEAAPFMALGFIRKDGLPFEKYAALVIRHRIGRLRLHFEAAPVLLTAPGVSNAAPPRKEKRNFHAWFVRQNHSRLEYEGFTVTKKARQRKRKAAQRKIAAARQEYRAAKRGAEKAAAAAGGAKKYLPVHQVSTDVRGRRL
jgi:short subunit dehydrogenase-like uncharacterized protein